MLNIPHILQSSTFVLNYNPTSYLKPLICVPHTAAIWKNIHFWQSSCAISSGFREWGKQPACFPKHLSLWLFGRTWGAMGAGKLHSSQSIPSCGQADSSPNTQPHQSLPWRQHAYPLFSQGTSFHFIAVPWDISHSKRIESAAVIIARTSSGPLGLVENQIKAPMHSSIKHCILRASLSLTNLYI